jgi:hypothetical protein
MPETSPVLSIVATAADADAHAAEAAGVPEPVSCSVAPVHIAAAPAIEGTLFTVMVVSTTSPLLLVKVISVVPAETLVTKPVLLMVATDGEADTHGLEAAGVPVPVNWVVAPLQMVNMPVITGIVVTVTDTVVTQPLLLVYVIVLVPAATPDTSPLLFTVAAAVLDDTHALAAAGVPLPVSCEVLPTLTVVDPLITGNGLTVTVISFEQPLLFVKVMILVPADTPVTRPVLFTVATEVVAEVHAPDTAGVPLPISWVVLPSQTPAVPDIAGSPVTVTVIVLVQPSLLV